MVGIGGEADDVSSPGSGTDGQQLEQLVETLITVDPGTDQFRAAGTELAERATDTPEVVAPAVGVVVEALDRAIATGQTTIEGTVQGNALVASRQALLQVVVIIGAVETARPAVVNATADWLTDGGRERLALGVTVGSRTEILEHSSPGELAVLADAFHRALTREPDVRAGHDTPRRPSGTDDPSPSERPELDLREKIRRFETRLADAVVDTLEHREGSAALGNALTCLERLTEGARPSVVLSHGETIIERLDARMDVVDAQPQTVATVCGVVLEAAHHRTPEVPAVDDPTTLGESVEILSRIARHRPEIITEQATLLRDLLPGHPYLLEDHPTAVAAVLEEHGDSGFDIAQMHLPEYLRTHRDPATKIIQQPSTTIDRSVDTIVSYLGNDPTASTAAVLLEILEEISMVHPKSIAPHVETLLDLVKAGTVQVRIADDESTDSVDEIAEKALIALWHLGQRHPEALRVHGQRIADAIDTATQKGHFEENAWSFDDVLHQGLDEDACLRPGSRRLSLPVPEGADRRIPGDWTHDSWPAVLEYLVQQCVRVLPPGDDQPETKCERFDQGPRTSERGSGPVVEVTMERYYSEEPAIPVLVAPKAVFDHTELPVPRLPLIVDRLYWTGARTAAGRIDSMLNRLASRNERVAVRIALLTVERITVVRPDVVVPVVEQVADTLDSVTDSEMVRSALSILLRVADADFEAVEPHLPEAFATDTCPEMARYTLAALETLLRPDSGSTDHRTERPGSNASGRGWTDTALAVLGAVGRVAGERPDPVTAGVADRHPNRITPDIDYYADIVTETVVDCIVDVDDPDVVWHGMFVLHQLADKTSPFVDLTHEVVLENVSCAWFYREEVTELLAEHLDHGGIRYHGLGVLFHVARRAPQELVSDIELIVKVLERCTNERSARVGFLTLTMLARANASAFVGEFEDIERIAKRFDDPVIDQALFDLRSNVGYPGTTLTSQLTNVFVGIMATSPDSDESWGTPRSVSVLESLYEAVDCTPRGAVPNADVIGVLANLAEAQTAVQFGGAALSRLAEEHPETVAPHAETIVAAIHSVGRTHDDNVPFNTLDGMNALANIARIDPEAAVGSVEGVADVLKATDAAMARPGSVVLQVAATERPAAVRAHLGLVVEVIVRSTDPAVVKRGIGAVLTVAEKFPEDIGEYVDEIGQAIARIDDASRLADVLAPTLGHPTSLKPVVLDIVENGCLKYSEPRTPTRQQRCILNVTVDRILDGREPPEVAARAMDLLAETGSTVRTVPPEHDDGKPAKPDTSRK